VQVNNLFVVVDILTEKKIINNVLLKHQQNYIKVIKTHLCIINHHSLVKKLISMMKVDFL